VPGIGIRAAAGRAAISWGTVIGTLTCKFLQMAHREHRAVEGLGVGSSVKKHPETASMW